MPSWPSGLSKRQLISEYKESAPDMVLRSETDHGPAKTRRRFTSAPREVSFKLMLSTTEVDVIDTFFVDTINGGAASFDMVNPRTGSTDSYRFLEPPEYAPLSIDQWSVACKLEKLP